MIRVAPASSAAELEGASHLYDGPARAEAVVAFLAQQGHHLLLARVDDDPRPAGFVSGVEMVHPDKGREMFLYELGVEEAHRGIGVGTALVHALVATARAAGCYGMWVLTDHDNDAALATYRKGGATDDSPCVMLTWELTAT